MPAPRRVSRRAPYVDELIFATTPKSPTTLASGLGQFGIAGSEYAYLKVKTLSGQLVEQRLRIFQVGGVEAFGEPVVDFRENRAGFAPPRLRRANRRAIESISDTPSRFSPVQPSAQ